MLVCDFSQLELRILAHYSRDEQLMEVFRTKGDPHQLTADLIDVERWVGKTLNFAWVYGAYAKTLCTTIEKEGRERPLESDAKLWLKSFDNAYPTLVDWKKKVFRYATKLGYVKNISGRYRRLPNLRSQSWSAKSKAERQAVNAIIQGSAADVIQLAMIRLAAAQGFYDATMLAQGHDELVFIVADDKIEAFAKIVQRTMEGAGEHFGLRVPLIAEPGIGDSWAEAK